MSLSAEEGPSQKWIPFLETAYILVPRDLPVYFIITDDDDDDDDSDFIGKLVCLYRADYYLSSKT